MSQYENNNWDLVNEVEELKEELRKADVRGGELADKIVRQQAEIVAGLGRSNKLVVQLAKKEAEFEAYHVQVQALELVNGHLTRKVQELKAVFAATLDTVQRDKIRLAEALRELVARCDGECGVRADGSNIDTTQAHAALGDFDND